MGLERQARPLGYTVRSVLRAVLLVAVLGLVVWANHHVQINISGRMTQKDFMSIWTGAKAVILGLNPYDVSVWRPLRRAYGCSWNRDPISAWPLWTHLFFVPFSFLSPEVAGASWMTICELSLILGVSLMMQALVWESQLTLFALSAGAVLFRPALPAILNGQVSPLLFLILAAAYFLHSQGRPFIAGLLLSLEAVKPNLTAILLLTVAVVFLFRRDWRALTGLVAGGRTLLVISWIVIPAWPFRWLLVALMRKGGGGGAIPTVWGLVYEWGGHNCGLAVRSS